MAHDGGTRDPEAPPVDEREQEMHASPEDEPAEPGEVPTDDLEIPYEDRDEQSREVPVDEEAYAQAHDPEITPEREA